MISSSLNISKAQNNSLANAMVKTGAQVKDVTEVIKVTNRKVRYIIIVVLNYTCKEVINDQIKIL